MSFKLLGIRNSSFAKAKSKTYSKKNTKLLFIVRAIIFLALTAITQIGGVIYLITLAITYNLKKHTFLFRSLIFISLYIVATYIVTPKLAPYFGREKIETTEFVQAHSSFYSWTNRNYVTAELHQVLQNMGEKLSKENPGIKLVYLDANFPFINGFPLLPHRYHNDGKKIDVSFVYKDGQQITNKKPSFSGYGIYVNPLVNEWNQINACLDTGYSQYDFTKFVTLGCINPQLQFSESVNHKLLSDLLLEENVNTIFIEPHLVTRLGLENDKLVYHGCGTVRHDDHIHIEVK